MALGDSYATLAQLKIRLASSGTAWPDTNDDAAMTNALSTASREIEGWCGRQFNDVGAGNESARIYYPDTLTTVKVDDFQNSAGLVVAADYSNAGTYTTIIASANYQLEPLNNSVDGTTGWPFYRIRAIQTWYPIWYTSIGDPRTSIQITARWGWSAVPAGIVEACLMLAEDQFKRKDAPWGIAGTNLYGMVRVRDDPKVEALLARYVRSPIQVA